VTNYTILVNATNNCLKALLECNTTMVKEA